MTGVKREKMIGSVMQSFCLFTALLLLHSTSRVASTNVGIVLSSNSGNVTVRSTVLLVCVAGGSVSSPTVTWQHEGNTIQENVQYTVHNTSLNITSQAGLNFVESILEICDIGLQQGGNYVCTASHEGNTTSTTISVTVLETPVEVNISGRGTLDESDTLELNCTASPSANRFTWTKRSGSREDGTETVETVLASPRVSITTNRVSSDISWSTLVVRNVDSSDGGNYTCVADESAVSSTSHSSIYNVYVNTRNECASNPCLNGGTCEDLFLSYSCNCPTTHYGRNCEKVTTKEMETPPDLVEPPENTNTNFTTPINLTCAADGHPPPTYQWYKDDKILPGERQSFLYIAEPDPQDRGNYSCVAMNTRGNVSSDQAQLDIPGIIQYSANITFNSATVTDQLESQILSTIQSGNISMSLVHNVKVLNSSGGQMSVLITLANITMTTNRTALLKVIESDLNSVLKSLPMAKTVQLIRYDGCNPISEAPDGITWPEARPGETVSATCPCADRLGMSAGEATRTCEGTYSTGASWGPIDDSLCATTMSATTRLLCSVPANISDAPVAEQINVSQIVENITSTPESLTAADVSGSVVVLVELTQGAIMNEMLRTNYLQSIDNIQKADPDKVLQSQTETKSSVKILDSLERFQDRVVLDSENTTTNETATFTFKTFAIQIQEINPKTFKGQTFSVDLGSVADTMNITDNIPEGRLTTSDTATTATKGDTASVQLSENVLNELSSCNLSTNNSESNQRRISHSVFLSDILFQNENQSNYELGSIIVATRLPCAGNTTLSNMPIRVSFRVNRETKANSSSSSCASWSTEEAGKWSLGANCKEVVDEAKKEAQTQNDLEAPESKETRVFHYTQFAHFGLLFDVTPEKAVPHTDAEAITLAVITYVGLSFSIICLIIFILSYLCIKKLRTSPHGQILINMSSALMAMYIVFLIGGFVTSIPPLCGVFSGLLHYFFLVFFGWTTVEVIWLYLKLVKVFGIQSFTSRFVLKAAIPTWILPLVIVGISAGAAYVNYHNQYFCRVTMLPFWIGMILPFGLLYIVNWVMFVIIMASICKHTRGTEVKNQGKLASTRNNAVIALTLGVIFGLGWGIGLAATSGTIKQLTFAFQILFSIVVGTQGALIFLFHGIRNKDVRNLWLQCFSRLGGKKLINNIMSLTKSSTAGTQSSLQGTNGSSSTGGTLMLSQKKPISNDYDSVPADDSVCKDITKVEIPL